MTHQPIEARRCRAPALAIPIGLGLLLCSSCSADPTQGVLEGIVVAVTDGDTLTLLVDEREVRIRLAQIDAPEKAQPYGGRSKTELTRLSLGKPALVQVVDTDDYGRVVGELFVGDVHVNKEMVQQGHAWAYTRYARSVEIIDLENEARRLRRGLWTLPEAERDPPWVWRHEKRRADSKPKDPRCAAKRSCPEMASCAEARFFLTKCGLAALDGDGDGVPCEKLCTP